MSPRPEDIIPTTDEQDLLMAIYQELRKLNESLEAMLASPHIAGEVPAGVEESLGSVAAAQPIDLSQHKAQTTTTTKPAAKKAAPRKQK